jgi:hypothetical protein
VTFLVWDNGVTLRAKDYDNGGSASYAIGWKSIDGIKTLVGE